jgi:hypothetical protein
LRKGAFLHYIELFKTRRCNDYAFLKNAAAFYQKSALSAEDGRTFLKRCIDNAAFFL